MHELCIINSPGFISCKKNSRRRVMYPTEFVQESVKHVPLRKRLTQQKLAKLLGVSIMTVHCWIAALTIQVHCNKLKPVLTEKNKWARLEMALSFVDPTDPTKFQDMRDRVNLDVKWFFLTREKDRYLLLPEEDEPTHFCNIIHT